MPCHTLARAAGRTREAYRLIIGRSQVRILPGSIEVSGRAVAQLVERETYSSPFTLARITGPKAEGYRISRSWVQDPSAPPCFAVRRVWALAARRRVP